MTVNYEIKSHLARLLAQEDLVVQNKNVETASFNVETRVLTLPMWKKASNAVYDMLVSHETAHALYTPNEDWQKKADIPHAYLNVTEDARIEKLMKRRYGGMTKTFYRGYQQLSEIDFFDLQGVDIDDMNFADRANLYFKIGNFVDIPIKNDEERSIIDLMNSSETFDDAIEAAKVLHAYCKKEKEEKEQESQLPQPEGKGKSGQQQSGGQSQDTGEQSEGQSGEKSQETTESGSESSDQPKSEGDGEAPEVETDSTLNEKLKELNGNVGTENTYCTLPNVHIDKVLVSNKKLQDIMNHWYTQYECLEYRDRLFATDLEYQDIKRSASKEVNYMVKEFECKKSADAYSRATTSKTGVLNTSALHTYKYNEDLFKKVTVIPEGKNHGLVFLLDWSGSMAGIMESTAKQLLNIIWFCSKVNIPFDVYLFSNAYDDYHGRDNIYNTSTEDMVIDKELDKLYVGKSFKLLNLITSAGKKSDLDKQLKNFWRLVKGVSSYRLEPDPRLYLGGTPLNEALICLHKVLPAFQAKHKVQKTQCVVLTDGEASHIPCTTMVKNYRGEETFGARYLGSNSFLTNKKTGHTYELGKGYYTGFTATLIRDLRDSFPNTNFIGIRLGPPSTIKQMARLYDVTDQKTLETATKQKFINIKTSGYHSYFVMNSKTLFSDTDFEVQEDASKSQIKSAFNKSLKSKAMNKKMLSQFMDLVC